MTNEKQKSITKQIFCGLCGKKIEKLTYKNRYYLREGKIQVCLKCFNVK
jgi:hypothetical protein